MIKATTMKDKGKDAKPRRERLVEAIPCVPISSPDDLPKLLDDHANFLKRYARKYVGEPTLEDFWSDLTLYLLPRFERIKGHPLDAATRWIRRQRTRPVELSLEAVEPTVPPAEGLIEMASVGREIIAACSRRDQRIVALAWRGRSNDEIADAVGVKPNTVAQVLCRIRKKILHEMSAQVAVFLGMLGSGASRLRFWRSLNIHSATGTMTRLADQWSPLGLVAPVIIAVLTLGPGIPAQPTRPTLARENHQIPVGPRKVSPVALPAVMADGGGRVSTGPRTQQGRDHVSAVGGTALDPQTVHLAAAVASPNYADDHTIVAAGTDQACGCWRTWLNDDGQRWTPGPAPVAGVAQLFLPSSYPQDPEVFASDGAELWRAASFGQEFRPVGIVTGSAGFVGLVRH